MSGNERRWSVGELARATGLTVRTLHHYDEIGLVEPTERTASGHRRYTDADVRRLYRVRALRSLGLGLDAIAESLAAPDTRDALRQVLASQLDHLDREARRMRDLRAQVRSLLERMTSTEGIEVMSLLETMQMIEDYYTPEQLDYLAKRREELGEDAIKEVERAWPEVIAAMTAHQQADTPVDDPQVQAVTRRWIELGDAFTGGDPGIRDAVTKMLTDQGGKLGQQGGCMSPELFEYVSRAIAAVSGGRSPQ
ncbi:MerR family transcriptional regulator [Actinokineospora iranica]|uniref:DNA-binding transcriptional regulator, MerR family n=1 Tax=Actinokineospora iranica TaxID=1271860 RepID=A0A1G6PLA5_9PSEU|nr:MerR family transcriptional regulator [Actinokineospora iranica]SDC80829.1 DNA-binding transcriptional regulator, MerR family [Actinokineospora iranica]